jgi:chloramphenicol-sensitive protein RarD
MARLCGPCYGSTVTAAEIPERAPGLGESHKGLIYCFLAHLVWGGMAAYFGLLRHVSPTEIAIHRGLWSLLIAAIAVALIGTFPQVWRALKQPKLVATLAFTAFLIVFNWGFYVWSIEQHRTLESSLGYFINPLLNVIAGYLFLGERFSRVQLLAISIAAIAVVIETTAVGVFPWLGLMLSATFCLYGFIRKTIAIGPIEGFLIETALIAPPAIVATIWLADSGHAHFLTSARDTLLLIGCGVLTAAALMFFALAIRRIRYSTAGLMQYISPSLVFLTAVFVFGEPLNGWRILSFVLIWIALAIYTASAIMQSRPRPLDTQETLA